LVERDRKTSIATFFTPDLPVAGAVLTLGEDAAHHMRVRRMAPSERIRVSTGSGTIGEGVIARIGKTQVSVDIDRTEEVEPLPDVHLIVPIADRERMLWLGEKSVELGATTWRPVMWRRSKGVSPRGEGSSFQAKLRARMISALEQSGSAWLPTMYPDALLDRAIAATPVGSRFVLDRDGAPVLSASMSAPVSVAIGPEGGLDPSETAELVAAGFQPVSIASGVLRFETAAVAGLTLARASLAALTERTHER
jgi:16S rRNA (uracil1498-N3)-methyltransferase